MASAEPVVHRPRPGASSGGFTLVEMVCVAVIGALVASGLAAITKLALDAKNRRVDQVQVMLDGRETLDIIRRLIGRAVGPDNSALRRGDPKTFQGAQGYRGIHFWAEVHEPPDGVLEHVWIWADLQRTQNEAAWPFDRRRSVKVAVFGTYPRYNNPRHDRWTRRTDAFYTLINHDAANRARPFLVIGTQATDLRFAVDTLPNGSTPRVRVWGGFHNDRSGNDLAWSLVAPSSTALAMTPPSETVSATIFPRSLYSSRAPGNLGNWNASNSINQTVVRDSEFSYLTASTPVNPAFYPKFAGTILAR